MELEWTNLKKDEDIPDLLTRALEDNLQEERVTQWMRLCVGALKEWMEKLQAGEPLRRPLDHVGPAVWGRAPPETTSWPIGCGRSCASPTQPTRRGARREGAQGEAPLCIPRQG